jgi:hypothetical protein
METWQREWLTRTLLAEAEIAAMTTAAFLRWAETHSRDIDMWLAVPAVRQKIREINNAGTAVTKRKLGKLLAGNVEGRPRMPDDRVIHTLVCASERQLQPIHAHLITPRNRASLWAAIKTDQPLVAAEIEELGLREAWFGQLRPATQNRTPWYMACELVAARNNLKVSTVAKVAGRVRSLRDPRRWSAAKKRRMATASLAERNKRHSK